jgi:hypothetical protein
LELAGSVTPAVVPPIPTAFYTGLMAVDRSGAGGEKRTSRRGCEHEHERSCDLLREQSEFFIKYYVAQLTGLVGQKLLKA